MAHLVVLDACVLVRAAVRDSLLRAAEQEAFRPLWSDEILDEVVRALQDKFGKSPRQIQHLLDELRQNFPESTVAGYEQLVSSMTVHPGDRHVAAAAVAGRANVILTFDLDHFPQAALDPYFIEVQSPDEYLVHLFHLDSDAMGRIIEEQATDLRRGVHTPQDVCARLRAQGARNFANLVESKL